MKKLMVLALISSSVMASDWIEEDWSRDSVITSYKGEQQWSAKIRHAKNSTQRMFFFYERTGNSPCNPSTIKKNAIWKFNGQPVQIFQWCKKYADTERYYVYATSATDKGDKFIVSTFKAKSFVYIEPSSDFNWKVNLSAKGFSKAWNSYGGDAL